MELYRQTVYVLEAPGNWLGVFSIPHMYMANQVFSEDLVTERCLGMDTRYKLIKVQVDDSIYGNRGVVQNWQPDELWHCKRGRPILLTLMFRVNNVIIFVI